jgi:hypothetical protein
MHIIVCLKMEKYNDSLHSFLDAPVFSCSYFFGGL